MTARLSLFVALAALISVGCAKGKETPSVSANGACKPSLLNDWNDLEVISQGAGTAADLNMVSSCGEFTAKHGSQTCKATVIRIADGTSTSSNRTIGYSDFSAKCDAAKARLESPNSAFKAPIKPIVLDVAALHANLTMLKDLKKEQLTIHVKDGDKLMEATQKSEKANVLFKGTVKPILDVRKENPKLDSIAYCTLSTVGKITPKLIAGDELFNLEIKTRTEQNKAVASIGLTDSYVLDCQRTNTKLPFTVGDLRAVFGELAGVTLK